MTNLSDGRVLRHLGGTKLELGPVGPGDGPWRHGEADDLVWLVLDHGEAPVNVVSRDVIEGLSNALDTLEHTTPRAVVIRSGKMAGFAVGADVTSFEDMSSEGAADILRKGHDVLDRLEALDCPTICVVHGAALGAGFEIALACDWRIAVNGASFGLPEVQLGLHPGLGGTFRLPELIDPTEAMTLMLTGKTAHTSKAKKLGIVDVITEERHIHAAVEAAASGKIERDGPSVKARVLQFDSARSLAARKMRSETEKKVPKAHYPAPYALIDLWEEYGDDSKARQAAEIESFANLLDTETSKNLRRVFFLRQGMKNSAHGTADVAHVHVIGAGVMGAEIAGWAALKGYSVTLEDVDLDPLGKAVKQARDVCKDQHLSGMETRDAMDRLMPDPKGYGLASADLVIEAGPETVDLKRKIYSGLSGRMKADAILATNTSSLRLAELRDSVPDEVRFAGLHFFNPVSKMQLVEVVRHDKTEDAVIDRLAAFCGSLDRLPVRVTDYPGFLVNRALTPYLMEALVLMDEGVEKEQIDAAAIAFGMPLGPVALSDQVGLDICLHVAESLKANLDEPIPEISKRLRDKVESGETGKKAGQGFYDWSNGPPRPEATGGPDDLTDRLILPMLDACVECLRKGVAGDPDKVDGAMVFATGFPPFRGGPTHYARALGTQVIHDRLTDLASRHGARFSPDPGWKDL